MRETRRTAAATTAVTAATTGGCPGITHHNDGQNRRTRAETGGKDVAAGREAAREAGREDITARGAGDPAGELAPKFGG